MGPYPIKSSIKQLIFLALAVLVLSGCPRSRSGEDQVLAFSAAGEMRPSLEDKQLFKSRKGAKIFSDLAPSLASRDMVMAGFVGGQTDGYRLCCPRHPRQLCLSERH